MSVEIVESAENVDVDASVAFPRSTVGGTAEPAPAVKAKAKQAVPAKAAPVEDLADDEGDEAEDGEPQAEAPAKDTHLAELDRRRKQVRRLQREKGELAKRLAGYDELRAKVSRSEHLAAWSELHAEALDEEGTTLSKSIPVEHVWKLLDYEPSGEASKENIIQTLLDRREDFPFLFAAGGSEVVGLAPQGAASLPRTLPAPGVPRGALVKKPDSVEAQVDADFRRTGRTRSNHL